MWLGGGLRHIAVSGSPSGSHSRGGSQGQQRLIPQAGVMHRLGSAARQGSRGGEECKSKKDGCPRHSWRDWARLYRTRAYRNINLVSHRNAAVLLAHSLVHHCEMDLLEALGVRAISAQRQPMQCPLQTQLETCGSQSTQSVGREGSLRGPASAAALGTDPPNDLRSRRLSRLATAGQRSILRPLPTQLGSPTVILA